MKNFILVLFTLVFTVLAQAQVNIQPQAEPGRTLKNPSDILENNQCVFRQKNIAALQGYDLIVDACDRRYTSALVLVSDRMKPGMCAYDLLQNMTGYTLARVVKPCPTRNVNPLVENAYAEEPPLEEVVVEEKLETPQEVVTPKAAAKPKVKTADEAMADIKGEAKPAVKAKPKKEKVVEVKPGEYVVAPDELDF